MAQTKYKTVVGVFQSRERAQQAVNELKQAGFRDDQIGVVARNGEGNRDVGGDDEGESYAGEGAVTGLATGAGVGALWGLGIIAGVMPVLGPAIAGGALAAVLTSAAAGAAAAGLAGALIGMGIPKEEAEYYEGEFKAGRTLVTVSAEGRESQATAILRRLGGYDISSRSEAGMESATHTRSAASSGMTSAALGSGQTTLQAREEELRVRKQPMETTGEVRAHKEVHTEHKSINVPVTKEEVVIERHPASGRQASNEPIGNTKSQEVRIPIREEQVTVEKTPVVKEEVTIGKRKTTENRNVDATVRKEEIVIDKDGRSDTCDR